jgi:hypothetical protein
MEETIKIKKHDQQQLQPVKIPEIGITYWHKTSHTNHQTSTGATRIVTKGFIKHQTAHIRALINYGTHQTSIKATIPNDPNQLQFSVDALSLAIALHHVSTTTDPPNTSVRVGVNNPSVARRVQNRRKTTQRETNTMSSDWDIIETIHQLSTTLQNIQVESLHQTNDELLMDLDEQLCSEIHSQGTYIDQQTHQRDQYQAVMAPTLLINKNRVSGDYTTALRDCTNKGEAMKYYQDKYEWTKEVVQSIDWRAHGKALSQLSQRQQKTITQFIHNWLPTNAAHSQHNLGTGRLCPFCRTCEESQHHFLQCPHPQATTHWTEMANRTRNKLRQYHKNIDHRLVDLIKNSILVWRTTESPEVPTTLPQQYHQLFQAQQKIGWNQIIKGRFANEWQLTLDTTQEGNTKNWVTYCVRIILQGVFEVWKLRCEKEHGTTKEDIRQRALNRLTPQVSHLFDQKENIDQSDAQLFNKSKEDILIAPTAIIENWVFKTSIRVKDSIKRRRQKEKNTILPIHPFFHTQGPIKHISITKQKQTQDRQFRPTLLTHFFQSTPKTHNQTKNDLRPP